MEIERGKNCLVPLRKITLKCIKGVHSNMHIVLYAIVNSRYIVLDMIFEHKI